MSEVEKVPMTPQGAQKLREELNRLREERPKISRDIETAREHGDLSENAEYHAAKERQGMVEARIKDIEDKLARAEVIDPTRMSSPQAKAIPKTSCARRPRRSGTRSAKVWYTERFFPSARSTGAPPMTPRSPYCRQ